MDLEQIMGKVTRYIVDPDSGWRYGFPKVYDPKPEETMREWLIRRGYPEKDADFGAKHYRYWEG